LPGRSFRAGFRDVPRFLAIRARSDRVMTPPPTVLIVLLTAGVIMSARAGVGLNEITCGA
jgi:hypothetical protein